MPAGRRPSRHRGLLALAIALATLAPPAAAGEGEPVSDARETHLVTLVTGDRVLVERLLDGRYAAAVDPAPREGAEPTFETRQVGADLYVVPDDAAPLIPERLDRELFNVTELLRRDLAGASPDGVPLLVTFDGPASSLPGTEPVAQLESIHGQAAVVADADDLGAAIADATEPGDPDPLDGVEKIWLDAPVEAALEQSTAQIGVPAARGKGLDGAGVTVAILDTGVDATHPDLQGRVAVERNFSSSGTARDLHGHGTHVASIVGGTGAASNGARRGVAPGAVLLSGKVLNDNGIGLSSWIIQGMEWAVAEGADVVNLSLGGAPTDGTDPMSLSVDALTEESGTLFVIAAGNDGPATRTIATPGAASAALTVGAVSKSDTLAAFSSRGPRLGDFAIKPDLTAPGVSIAAARASGTSLGTPIDASYTRASGTSMATPHAAGAAALLAQQHPAWDADELKPALVSTALPRTGLTVYQQGGGRVDLAQATGGPVVAAPAPLDLGFFLWPHGGRDPVTRAVTLTNIGTEDVSLDLALEVTNEDGKAPAPGMLSLAPASVTLPAGGEAEVEVTLDPDLGATGLYGGSLVGRTGGAVRVRAPVGFLKEAERYELVVRGIARDGLAAAGLSRVQVLSVDDLNAFREERFFLSGEGRFRVPPGTYDVFGSLRTTDATGRLNTLAWVMDPELEVTGDTVVTLDARDAAPIRVTAAGFPTVAQQIKLNRYREALAGGSMHNGHVIGFEVPVFAAPTEPVTEGAFEFNSQWTLKQPGPDGKPSAASPYLFDLVFPFEAVPAILDELVVPDALARVDTGFAAQLEPRDYEAVWRNGWRPWQFFALDLAATAPAPFVRAEYISPGDTRWRQNACPRFVNFVEAFACLIEPSAFYAEGEIGARTWARQPWHPVPLLASRDRFTLTVLLDPINDGAGHASIFTGGLQESLVAYEEGSQVAQESAGFVQVFSTDERRRFRLEYETRIPGSWARLSGETRTVWEFDSGPERSAVPILDDTSGFEEVPPLLTVGYDLSLDLLGRAPFPSGTNGPFEVGLEVGHIPGAEAGAVAGARLWLSYDDGATWEEAALEAAGAGSFHASVAHRPFEQTNGFVALRVEAWDEDDNRVEQVVERAYALTPPAEVRVNAGDGVYTDAMGALWLEDRAYAPGEWGYTNAASEVQAIGQDIAGTDDDTLYRFARKDPGAYRFDVPDGVYEVELGFAEPSNRSVGTRVFDVVAEGIVVLPAHDIVAHAGNRTADVHLALVQVDDGTLDLVFRRVAGATPIVNAIRVTQTGG